MTLPRSPTRREVLCAAAASLGANAVPGRADGLRRRARACILLWMTGGPPQHETWDPKPDAPAEIRGAFRPARTAVTGIQVCELMPRTARHVGKVCVLRAVHTDNPSHPGSSY